MNFTPVELKIMRNRGEYMTISMSRLNDGLDKPLLNTTNNLVYVPLMSKEFFESNFGEVKEIEND